jgi:hypothetical protein
MSDAYDRCVYTPDRALRGGMVMCHRVLLLDNRLSPGALRAYLLITDYANQIDADWPGEKRLAADLGISINQMKRHIAEIIELGLLRCVEDAENTYVIEDVASVYSDEKIQEAASKHGSLSPDDYM